jgi:hypothetical protein
LHDDDPALRPEFDRYIVPGAVLPDGVHECALAVEHLRSCELEEFHYPRSNLLPDRRQIQQVNCVNGALSKAIEPFCKMERQPYRVIDCAVGHIDYVSAVRKWRATSPMISQTFGTPRPRTKTFYTETSGKTKTHERVL